MFKRRTTLIRKCERYSGRVGLFWGAFLLLASLASADTEPASDVNEIVAGLGNRSVQIRRSSQTAAMEAGKGPDRKIVVDRLLHLLEVPGSGREFEGTLHLAIEALGSLRAEEAIVPLIRHLEFSPVGFRTEERIPSEWYYPAAKALVEIGKGVVVPLVTDLRREGANDLRKQLGAWVVLQVLGRSRAVQALEEKSPDAGLLRFSDGLSLADYISKYRQRFGPIKDSPNTKS